MPAAVVNLLDAGRGGTYFEHNGGKAARITIAWLEWQLKADAAARQMFVGAGCGKYSDPAVTLRGERVDDPQVDVHCGRTLPNFGHPFRRRAATQVARVAASCRVTCQSARKADPRSPSTISRRCTAGRVPVCAADASRRDWLDILRPARRGTTEVMDKRSRAIMYSERLTMGFEWASRLHATQPRKGVETPYLSHLLGVASLAIEYGGDEDDVIAAMLHDAVEDCGGLPMLEKIRTEFGVTVAKTIEQCSDSVVADRDEKLDWTVRKRAYVASVASKCERARFVTTCDKLHNATAILNDHRLGEATDGTTVWDRFGGKTREQTVAYYSAMVAALEGRVKAPLWQRLADTVASLEALTNSNEHSLWLNRLQQPI